MRLCERARAEMRTDVRAAEATAEAAYGLARELRDRDGLAEALRMKGHIAYLGGRYRAAAGAYRRAIGLLEKAGRRVDVGRTLSSALQTLIYLGRYEEGLEWAERARRIFVEEGDRLRLARLDSNRGNILHRQDRYEEALGLYARAVRELRELGDWESAAIALRNQAVCFAAVYDFDRAVEAYREAERIYRERGLRLLAAEVDDNIAHLHFLRGSYLEALELYEASGVEERGNTFHAAVGRLDRSELLLELNLNGEAGRLAGEAAARLEELGVRYERGKALAQMAVARFRMGAREEGLRLLRRAKGLFGRERNAGWEAACELYRAEMLLAGGKAGAAREAGMGALGRGRAGGRGGAEERALLVLVRAALADGKRAEARGYLEEARGMVNTLPGRYRVAMAEGAVLEAEGSAEEALGAYERAREVLETLRARVGGEGLRISFLADKQELYERLVRVGMAAGAGVERVYGYVEEAKSRSLAEAMGERAEGPGDGAREVRRELGWLYRELERAELGRERRAGAVRERIREAEERLSGELARRGRGAEVEPGGGWRGVAEEGQAALEYFVAEGNLYRLTVTRRGVRVAELGGFGEVERVCHLLRFQMARGTRGTGGAAWLGATEQHLRRLYALLLAGVEDEGAGHWVVIPHGMLHRVPFHALHDGEEYVVDRRRVSYAPSGRVYAMCNGRAEEWTGGAAVFGVGDARAPRIGEEAREVGERLRGAAVYLGEGATAERLREAAARCAVLHVATHGMHREDNPEFSSILLGDGRLCLYDLREMRVAAGLVTMSGCATGVAETRGADEVMGLGRGLLAAGAHAVHLSLWEVNDASAAGYMSSFYREMAAGAMPVEASRRAMFATREAFPHPYHWAAFAITGRTRNFSKGIFFQPRGDSERVSSL
jgi:tetratricopeptide (TPR) repeat protein